MSRNVTVKLSPYEQAINRLNDLPLKLDRIFSDALEDLRRQRDEARAEVERLRFILECRSNVLTYECSPTSPCVSCRFKEMFRKTAERQREACAEAMKPVLRSMLSRGQAADLCRATPLVTEVDK